MQALRLERHREAWQRLFKLTNVGRGYPSWSEEPEVGKSLATVDAVDFRGSTLLEFVLYCQIELRRSGRIERGRKSRSIIETSKELDRNRGGAVFWLILGSFLSFLLCFCIEFLLLPHLLL